MTPLTYFEMAVIGAGLGLLLPSLLLLAVWISENNPPEDR